MFICIRVFLFFFLICGIIYPISLERISHLIFHAQSKGSLLYRDNRLMGSALLGQYFKNPSYFWPRPSYTPEFPYNASHSQGDILFPLNPLLLQTIKTQIKKYQSIQKRGLNSPIPSDLLSGSGSGLDPHISLDAAEYQAFRVAQARNISVTILIQLIQDKRIQEAKNCVNILKLNQALDNLQTPLKKRD